METEITPKFINLGNKKRITNPCWDPREDHETWEGPVDDFDFDGEGLNQMNNYKVIRDLLEEFGIKFDKVWSVKMPTYNKSPLVKFLVSCKDVNVFWYKYEGFQQGSGQNNLIMNGNKIKTSTWKNISKESRLKKLKENGIFVDSTSSITIESA